MPISCSRARGPQTRSDRRAAPHPPRCFSPGRPGTGRARQQRGIPATGSRERGPVGAGRGGSEGGRARRDRLVEVIVVHASVGHTLVGLREPLLAVCPGGPLPPRASPALAQPRDTPDRLPPNRQTPPRFMGRAGSCAGLCGRPAIRMGRHFAWPEAGSASPDKRRHVPAAADASSGQPQPPALAHPGPGTPSPPRDEAP